MARLNTLVLLIFALAAGCHVVLGQVGNERRRAFVDGSMDIESIGPRRKAALYAWLLRKCERLQARAERRGETETDTVPCADLSKEDLAAAVRELADIELVELEDAADVADEEAAVAEADPDVSDAEAEVLREEADEADAAAAAARDVAGIADDIDQVIVDVDITADDMAAADALEGVDDPLSADAQTLVDADEAIEEADEALAAEELEAAGEMPDEEAIDAEMAEDNDTPAPADDAADAEEKADAPTEEVEVTSAQTQMADEDLAEEATIEEAMAEMAPPPEEEEPERAADEEMDAGVAGASCGSDGFVCDIPSPPKVTDPSYDPADVDWEGLVQTFKNIVTFEPRMGSFVIRAFFHDGAAMMNQEVAGSGLVANPGGTADDGSILLYDIETFADASTQATFAPFARAILAYMGDYYKCSAADLLTVTALYAGQAMGGFSDPSKFMGDGVVLYVGRLDLPSPPSAETVADEEANLPGEFEATPRILQFWQDIIRQNSNIPPNADVQPAETYWKFFNRDILALMGAHTLMDNTGCQDGGDIVPGERKAKTPCDSTARAKNLLWTNDFFKDMNAGKCTPRKVPALGVDGKPTSSEGGKGRTPSDSERAELRACTFGSADGLAFADNLQCTVDELRGGSEDPDIQAGESFKFSDWRPVREKSTCCNSAQCEPCASGSSEWWCDGAEEGTVHWPYTWSDCEFNFAMYEHVENGGYCKGNEGIQYAHEVDCSTMNERTQYWLDHIVGGPRDLPEDEFRDLTAIRLFEESQGHWDTYFNRGMNKLSIIGVTWSDHPTKFSDIADTISSENLPGTPMPVPSGLCPPLQKIFEAAATNPTDDDEDIDIITGSDDPYV